MKAINFKFGNVVDSMIEHNGRYILEDMFGGVAVYANCKSDLVTIYLSKGNTDELNEVCIQVITKDRLTSLAMVKEMFPMVNDKPKIKIIKADLSKYGIDFGVYNHDDVLSKMGVN